MSFAHRMHAFLHAYRIYGTIYTYWLYILFYP